MNDRVTFRRATREDIPQITSLLTKRWHRKQQHFFWLSFDSVLPSVVMCCFRGKELIGTFALHKRTLTNGCTCGVATHLYIDVEWRGKGYFRTLGELACNKLPGIDAVCSIPNLSGKLALERSLGYTTIGRIVTMTLDVSTHHCESTLACESITKDTTFPTYMDPQQYIMFTHDGCFRHWRYALNDMFSYSMISLPTGEYVIVKLFTEDTTGTRYGDIVDIECPLDEPDKLTELLTGAISHLTQQGALHITLWAMTTNPLYAIGKGLGFTDTNQERFFCMKLLHSSHNELYDFSRWHLVQADGIR